MKYLAGLMVIMTFLAFSACQKQMGEKDYYDLAQQYMKKGNWQQAEATFETIVKQYPNGLYTARATFMVGYLNANHLNNMEKARQYYQLFVDKYPNHELADDARFELEHLGQTDIPFLKNTTPASSDQENQSTAVGQ